jgi:hypothetical protein
VLVAILGKFPTSIFSTSARLEQDNTLVGELSLSIWREKARLELEDGTYELRREALLSGEFLLEKDGEVFARASKPSILENRFEIEAPGRALVLRKLSLWHWRYGLFDGDTQIGSISPQPGIFTRRTNIDVPADLPLPTRIFLFWLALIMIRRQSQAAAASS